MASKVQLCNRALLRLGAARITSLTDGTQEATLCNLLFNDIADEVMSSGSWSACIRRASLNATSTDPTYGYDYEFQLPTNPVCLRVLSTEDEEENEYEEYAIEGDKLLSDALLVNIKYIARITDTQSYGTLLSNCIVSRLAAELAYPITGQAKVMQSLMEQYYRDMQMSLSLDGSQGSTEVFVNNDLIDIR